MHIYALLVADVDMEKDEAPRGCSIFGADEGADRTEGAHGAEYCEHMPCLQGKIEALHRESRRDPEMSPARLDRYLHACGLVKACEPCGSQVHAGARAFTVQCLCGDPEHTVMSVTRLTGSCFPFHTRAHRAKISPATRGALHAVLPISALVATIGDCIQYANLPDLGNHLRSLLTLCVQPLRAGNNMYKVFGALRSPRCRRKGAAAVCEDAAGGAHATVCHLLLKESIPLLKKSKRADCSNAPEACQPTCVETSACINVLHGTLLGLYPLGAKRPTFNARVALACRLHDLLTAGLAEQLSFLRQHRGLVKLCFMEYSINILSDYMPSERAFLTEGSDSMQQFQTVCPTMCDAFRADHLCTGAEPWQDLDACASVCIERCMRICKCKIQGARPTAKTVWAPLPFFEARWAELPCTYGNYDLLRSACGPDIPDHVVRCAARIHSIVSVHLLLLDVLRQQRKGVARAHGACFTRAYAACNIHLCVQCCARARAFRPELRQCTETGRLCCIHCPEGTVVVVNMLGVMLRIAQCSFYMCPFCAEVRAWSGDGQDFLEGKDACALHRANTGRGGDEQVPSRGSRKPTDCRVCGHKNTVSPALVLPNLETKRLEVIGLCRRHAPFRHRIRAVWAYDDMQALVRDSAGRLWRVYPQPGALCQGSEMEGPAGAERARGGTRDAPQYHLVARWEMAGTAWGRLVRAVTSNPIHVEWMLHAPGETCRRLAFSAFMGEGFAMTTIKEGSAGGKEWVYTAMPVTGGEAERMLGYMMGMVEAKIQYNYADLGVAAGLCGHGSFEEAMFPDVRPKGPKDLERLFCSQAMVIVMRSCLDDTVDGSPSARARKIVDGMNSRTVAPSALYRALQGVMREVRGYPLGGDAQIEFCTGNAGRAGEECPAPA